MHKHRGVEHRAVADGVKNSKWPSGFNLYWRPHVNTTNALKMAVLVSLSGFLRVETSDAQPFCAVSWWRVYAAMSVDSSNILVSSRQTTN